MSRQSVVWRAGNPRSAGVVGGARCHGAAGGRRARRSTRALTATGATAVAAGRCDADRPRAGTGTPTKDYGVGATDLCEFMEFPSGLLQICGDSFAGQGVAFGPHYSPIALHVDTDSVDDPTGVRYAGVMGTDKPLLADPTPPGSSQLPAGIVSINRENYMLVTTTKDLVPATSRLVKAAPYQGNWPTVPKSERPASYAGGRQSQLSGYYDPIPTPNSPSGWVYIVANNFDRSASVELYRVTPQKFTDRSSWQGWSGLPGGGWNKSPTPLWPDQVGEMSVRQARRQDGAELFQRHHRKHGGPRRRRPDQTRYGACDDGGVRDGVAGAGGRVAAAPRQPVGPAVRRLPLAGLDAGRVARVHKSVEYVAAGRQCAIPRHSVRGEPVQALISSALVRTPPRARVPHHRHTWRASAFPCHW